MRTKRSTVHHALGAIAQTPVEPPTAEFADALERRLLGLAEADVTATPSNVLAFRRRISRGAAIGIVAGVMSGAGAAAVAIVTVRHADAPPAPAPVVTIPPTSSTDPVRGAPPTGSSTVSTSVEPASTLVPTTTPATTIMTATANPTTSAGAASVPPATTALEPPATSPPPSTTTPTEPPPTDPPTVITVATAPPSTAAPTASTEVHVAATMQLECAPTAGAISCSWSAVPAGTDHVIVLRSSSGDGHGRVLFPDAGAASITDSSATAGTSYAYLVHAMDAGNNSLGHSNAVTVTCCG